MFSLPRKVLEKVEAQKANFSRILKKSLHIKNEAILIISDYGLGENLLAPMLGYGYYYAARHKHKNVTLLFQETKKGFMHADFHVAKSLELLAPGSIIIVSVSNKLGRFGKYNSFRTYCKERDHRFLSATGIGDVHSNNFELFLEAMTTNYSRMKKRAAKIKKLWDKAKEIRVTTGAGTDLTFNVNGCTAISNIGIYHQAGEGGNMPAGEVYIPPRGMAGVQGILIIDGSLKTAESTFLVDEPVKIVVEEGKVVSLKGKYAPLLEKTFEQFENRVRFPERVRLIGELGIGINPAAVLMGSMIMDEKVAGTGHVAFGSNAWFGGAIKTVFHADQVFKNPTFYVDGKKMEV